MDPEELAEMGPVYLKKLYEIVREQNVERTNMYRIGEGLGLDRGGTEALVMYLQGEGLIELLSLSGSVGISDAGIRTIEQDLARCEPEPVSLERIVRATAESLPRLPLTPQQRSDIQADIDTMASQMASSAPKTVIFTACLDAIARILEGISGSEQAKGILRDLAAARKSLETKTAP